MSPDSVHRAAHGQRGSILVPAALVIVLALTLLWGVQLGYAYYAKRELQKAADLSALTAGQVLGRGDEAGCAAAIAAARANVQANLGAADDDAFSFSARCWRWDGADAALAPRYVRDPQPEERRNAVQVLLAMPYAALIPGTGGGTLSAEAVAVSEGDPVAAFSVGTRLAAVQPGALVNLLRGVGLDLDGTALLGYDAGLAGVKITPRGLLQALGIAVPADVSLGQLNTLLAARTLGLGEVLDAVVSLAGQESLLAANVGLLQAIRARLGIDDLALRLGSDTAERATGLFALIQSTDPASALGVELDALQVLATAIGVATGGHAIQATAGVDLGLLQVTPRFSVTEPPAIAIGGVGATAYTSQIRVHLPISAPGLPLLGGLANLRVDLPITVDLVDGKASVERLCEARDASGRDLATLGAQSSILKLCIGGPPAGADAGWPFSGSESCDQGLAPRQLLRLDVLGMNLASLNTRITTDALPAGDVADFHAGQSLPMPASANPLLLGQTVKHLTDALLASLLGGAMEDGDSLNGTAVPQALAARIWADARAQNGCDPAGHACRNALWTASVAQVEDMARGLQGFVGGLSRGTLDLVGNLLTLDILGALNNVGEVVRGLLGTVGDLLGVLLPTDPCTPRLLGAPMPGGSEAGCMNKLTSLLQDRAPSAHQSNAVIVLAGALLEALRPLLDGIGERVLKPVVEQVVGLQLGQTDVNLMSLDCDGKGVRLVY
ncbi:pilus assembly protein TadG-related protein [Bordetella sp. 2513F-2]